MILPEIFDLVQLEFEKRKEKGYTSRVTPLSNRIVCGECGGFFGSKVWHSTSKYRRTIWQCNQKFKNEKRCQTPHLNETVIQQLFIEAFNSTIQNKAEILACFQEIMDRLTNWQAIERKRDQIDSAILKLKDQVEALINRNSRVAVDPVEYSAQHDQLMQRFRDLQSKRSELTAQIGRLKLKHNQAKVYLQTLEQQSELLTEFDEGLFTATIERITIHSDELATVRFKDESELCWSIRKLVSNP